MQAQPTAWGGGLAAEKAASRCQTVPEALSVALDALEAEVDHLAEVVDALTRALGVECGERPAP